MTIPLLLVIFFRFTQDLQEEVLDMEFQQYARGLKTISEEDFARILLRYTNLSDASIEEYLNRVTERIIHAQVCPCYLSLSGRTFQGSQTCVTRLFGFVVWWPITYHVMLNKSK